MRKNRRKEFVPSAELAEKFFELSLPAIGRTEPTVEDKVCMASVIAIVIEEMLRSYSFCKAFFENGDIVSVMKGDLVRRFDIDESESEKVEELFFLLHKELFRFFSRRRRRFWGDIYVRGNSIVIELLAEELESKKKAQKKLASAKSACR